MLKRIFSSRGRKIAGLLAGLFLLVGAAGLYALVWHAKEQPVASTSVTIHSYKDEKTGLMFDYPEPLEQQDLSQEDEANKFVGRLTSMNPPMIVSVRYEDGLRAASVLSRQDPLDMVLSNIDKAYPNRYPGYSEQSRQKLIYDGREAAEVHFSYTGPSGERVKQRLVIIQVDDNGVVYLSGQAQEASFDMLKTDVFDPLFASVGF